MQREWEPEDLIAAWTMLDEDWRLVGNKTSVTRLGFSVLLKFSSWRPVFRVTPARYRRPRCGMWLAR